MTNITDVSRRDRTREALLTAALESFTEHGYDATTTASIAARAGVTEMTLFRHFPTKASLIVDDPYDPVIADAVLRRPAHEPLLRATVRGVRDAWVRLPPAEAVAMRERLRIIAVTPALRSALGSGSAATEAAIADALRARGSTRAEACIVAAAVIAGLSAALLDWSLSDDPDPSTALEIAFRALDDPAGPRGSPR